MKTLSELIDEERGLAALLLWSFCPGNEQLSAGAAVYGVRRDEDLLRGELKAYGTPPEDAKEDDVRRFFQLEKIKGQILYANHQLGHDLEKLTFDLGSI